MSTLAAFRTRSSAAIFKARQDTFPLPVSQSQLPAPPFDFFISNSPIGSHADLMQQGLGGIVIIEAKPSNAASEVYFFTDEAQRFTENVIMMSRAQLVDECIDYIFESFNNYQIADEFLVCDQVIRRVLENLEQIDPTLLVSFLVIALAGKAKLPSRSRLYSTAEKVFLREYGEPRTKKLLSGLQ